MENVYNIRQYRENGRYRRRHGGHESMECMEDRRERPDVFDATLRHPLYPILPGLTGFDFWVVKMDADLSEDFVWSVQGGTTAYDTPTAVVVDDDGNVYVVGNINDFSDVLSEL